MIHFLKLIRWQNIVLIILAQIGVRFFLLNTEYFALLDHQVTNFMFFVLVLATVCIAIAGNIINDIVDKNLDKINKPHKVVIDKFISEKNAMNLYVIFNILGVALGFIVANSVGKSSFSVIFVIISILLYLYSDNFQKIVLVGNIVISLIVAFSILIIPVFDLLPNIQEMSNEMNAYHRFAFSLVFDVFVIVFLINLIREVVKDQEDIKGDNQFNYRTLPIITSKEIVNIVIFGLTLLSVVLIAWYCNTKLANNKVMYFYILITLVGSLLFIGFKSLKATSKKDYHLLSNVLKLTMFFGIIATYLIKYTI